MKKLLFLLFAASLLSTGAHAQLMGPLQYYTPNDQTGLNQFESPQTTDVEFDGLRVRIGGSNTLQFQALRQSGASDDLVKLGDRKSVV